VVAIIAILAAIAVPNFLEAQTRSKVSRARADLRTMATALEAYHVDNNNYPFPHGAATARNPNGSQAQDGHGVFRNYGFATVPPEITTPIAYLTTVMADTFKQGRVHEVRRADGSLLPGLAPNPYNTGNPFDMTFVYHPVQHWVNILGQAFDWTSDDLADYGSWRMFSIGPDGYYNAVGTGDRTMGWIYDPTNGTVSSGMIIRTQNDPTGENFSRASQ